MKFLVVPQWQGSPSSRAMRLAEGALAIEQDLPRTATTRVDVPTGAGETLGSTVHRLSSVRLIAENFATAGNTHAESIVTIGGDCGVSYAAVKRAAASHPGMTLVWFDAHADFNSEQSSPSHSFSGMVLSAISGDRPELLDSEEFALAPESVLLAGAREIDAAEIDRLRHAGVTQLPTSAIENVTELISALEAQAPSSIYVHIDLDVLDPAEFSGVSAPVPFGVSARALTEAIAALGARWPLAGATIAGFAPHSPENTEEDLPTILRIIGALTQGARTHASRNDAAQPEGTL